MLTAIVLALSLQAADDFCPRALPWNPASQAVLVLTSDDDDDDSEPYSQGCNEVDFDGDTWWT